MTQLDFRSRIVGYGEEAPDQLLANPLNFRVHPKSQQDALKGVLEEVGYVQSVIVNRTTGNLIDGHLRVSLALRENQQSIPVVYVELSPQEEALVLATFDPISGLAGTDQEKLNELLSEVSTNSAGVEALLAQLSATGEDGTIYSVATNVPHYQIVGEQPKTSELYDMTKAQELRGKILEANLPDDVRTFLLQAADRHVVFDYRAIAEFYPHQSPEVQRLMEDSALIIIDFNSAIRNGYVKFTEAVAELEASDQHEA